MESTRCIVACYPEKNMLIILDLTTILVCRRHYSVTMGFSPAAGNTGIPDSVHQHSHFISSAAVIPGRPGTQDLEFEILHQMLNPSLQAAYTDPSLQGNCHAATKNFVNIADACLNQQQMQQLHQPERHCPFLAVPASFCVEKLSNFEVPFSSTQFARADQGFEVLGAGHCQLEYNSGIYGGGNVLSSAQPPSLFHANPRIPIAPVSGTASISLHAGQGSQQLLSPYFQGLGSLSNVNFPSLLSSRTLELTHQLGTALSRQGSFMSVGMGISNTSYTSLLLRPTPVRPMLDSIMHGTHLQAEIEASHQLTCLNSSTFSEDGARQEINSQVHSAMPSGYSQDENHGGQIAVGYLLNP
jgi:hypothetical protein